MDSALHNFITHTTGSIFDIKLQGEICNAKVKNSPAVTFPTAWHCQDRLTGCLWSYLPCSYSRAGVLVFRCWGPEKAVGMKVAVMACVSCSHSLISWFGPVVILPKHTLLPNSSHQVTGEAAGPNCWIPPSTNHPGGLQSSFSSTAKEDAVMVMEVAAS